MHIGEKRERMWIFIFLYILGLNIFQAAGNEDSTQMHYVRLIIDASVLEEHKSMLQSQFNNSISNVTLHIPNITTVCENDGTDGTKCNCIMGYRWSDDICQSNKKCCAQSECTFKKSSSRMCVSESSVTITGTINLPIKDYEGCLLDPATNDYETCHGKVLKKLKEVYSTLNGFDTLTIIGFRLGSVIAEFTTTIVSTIKSDDLFSRSQTLCTDLQANMELETREISSFHSIVSLFPPNYTVKYHGQATITCETMEDLKAVPKWTLIKPDTTKFQITSGTQAIVDKSEGKKTMVKLLNVTELWEGQYQCVYRQKKGKTTIVHIANDTIDISLLPNIEAYTEPPFPQCTTEGDSVRVKAVCEIQKSTEPYTVKWNFSNSKKSNRSSAESLMYEAELYITCGDMEFKNITCTFTNRCGQDREKQVPISIIQANELYCPAEGEWKDTKKGFTAELKCKDRAGLRKRRCSDDGKWQNEESECVNAELNNVLQNALIVDIGRGVLDDNIADVFSKLHNVTETIENVNSYSDINASVSVFTTLNEKLHNKSLNITSLSTTDNFLSSSDNLLEKSLEKAWTSKDSELPDKYLVSVEQLIKIANITGRKSSLSNLEVDVCPNVQHGCNVSVFNVSIKWGAESSGTGSLKTAGFQYIQSYLRNNNSEEYEPNSIVVSAATTDGKKEKIKIKIDFQLLKPRPRNVQIKCVARDHKTNKWSEKGCKWGGPYNEKECICDHLSSFAILMSKRPIDLPWTSEITTVGLSVSVVSLVLSLLIELIVWSSVVKTNTLYLRHTAHINISLSLLVADCCFLASAEPKKLSDIWCSTVVVVKHFCYLSMFFWMLCLSSTLLHQAVFLFHKVSKKYYLRFSLVVGYACPFLIVLVTFLTNGAGRKDHYYSRDTCWLVYGGLLKGSIYTFIIPVCTIVFFNVFSMVVVILKLLDHHNAEKLHEKDKSAAKTVLRTVVFLTPIFGVTWMLGFGVMLVDLTDQIMAPVINYTFILLNSFQGFFIFLTTCLGDKMTRDALLHCFKKKIPASISDSTMKTDSTMKK